MLPGAFTDGELLEFGGSGAADWDPELVGGVVLPEIRGLLAEDVRAAVEGDPAATGPDEVILCYPGLYAITVFRIANRLLGQGAAIVPRMLTELAHARTGIDLHPGATIEVDPTSGVVRVI